MSILQKLQLSTYLIRHSAKTGGFLSSLTFVHTPPMLGSHVIRCALPIEDRKERNKNNVFLGYFNISFCQATTYYLLSMQAAFHFLSECLGFFWNPICTFSCSCSYSASRGRQGSCKHVGVALERFSLPSRFRSSFWCIAL